MYERSYTIVVRNSGAWNFDLALPDGNPEFELTAWASVPVVAGGGAAYFICGPFYLLEGRLDNTAAAQKVNTPLGDGIVDAIMCIPLTGVGKVRWPAGASDLTLYTDQVPISEMGVTIRLRQLTE